MPKQPDLYAFDQTPTMNTAIYARDYKLIFALVHITRLMDPTVTLYIAKARIMPDTTINHYDIIEAPDMFVLPLG